MSLPTREVYSLIFEAIISNAFTVVCVGAMPTYERHLASGTHSAVTHERHLASGTCRQIALRGSGIQRPGFCGSVEVVLLLMIIFLGPFFFLRL